MAIRLVSNSHQMRYAEDGQYQAMCRPLTFLASLSSPVASKKFTRSSSNCLSSACRVMCQNTLWSDQRPHMLTTHDQAAFRSSFLDNSHQVKCRTRAEFAVLGCSRRLGFLITGLKLDGSSGVAPRVTIGRWAR